MRKKKKENKIFKIIISILLVLSSLLLFYFINKLNVLGSNLLIFVGAILILMYSFILFKLFRRKTRKFSRVFFYMLSIVLIVVYSFGINYLYTTINFVENVTTVAEYEIQTYSVLVHNDSNYKNITDLNDKNIGFISLTNSLEDVNKKLQELSKITFVSKEYNEISQIIESINNFEVDAIVLEQSFVDSLEQNDYHLSNSVRSIYTFELKVKKEKTTQKVDVVNEPFILYISGSDSWDSLYSNFRSDVNILAVVNPKNHKILLLSVPRDTYVQLHNTVGTKDKLTHAGLYGIEMSKNTLEDFLNLDINYYAKVSFNTLIDVVDVIGGIDLYSEKSFRAWTNHKCRFNEGINSVDGKCALAFARERMSYGTGDIHRGQNQQQVITKIIEKLSNPSILTKYNDILNSIDGSFETDMTYYELTNLVKNQLNKVNKWNVESIVIKGEGKLFPTYSLGSKPLYVMIPDENSVLSAKAKINEYLK